MRRGRRIRLRIWKTRMRKALSSVVAVAVILTLVPISSASAGVLDRVGSARKVIGDVRQKVEAKQEEIRTQVQGEFCGRFAEVTGEMAGKMTEARNRIAERADDRESGLEDRRDTRDEKLSDIRSEQDARRLEWYAKLQAKASTDEERRAVETFRKTVDGAVEVRRDAVDAAIASFRSAVDSLVDGKKGTTDAAVEEFRKGVDAAVVQAKADCEAGKDPETIRNTFKESLKAARGKLVERRKTAEGIGSQVETLAKTRTESVRQAQDAFRKTLEQALAELKKAFPEHESAD